MTFNTSQTKRFYQVYPQDSKTTVGHFNLKGTLVAQQSDGKRELSKVCQSGNGCHAEERFLSECAKQLGTISEGEKATLSLNIKITYSPCSKCRTAIKNFFASLPQDRNSSYQLCIQFANLYHEKSASTVDEIKHLAAWSQSLKDINVVADLKPLCVTKDPEFNPTNLDISCDKIIRKRERKDKEVERHVQQIASLKVGCMICYSFHFTCFNFLGKRFEGARKCFLQERESTHGYQSLHRSHSARSDQSLPV